MVDYTVSVTAPRRRRRRRRRRSKNKKNKYKWCNTMQCVCFLFRSVAHGCYVLLSLAGCVTCVMKCVSSKFFLIKNHMFDYFGFVLCLLRWECRKQLKITKIEIEIDLWILTWLFFMSWPTFFFAYFLSHIHHHRSFKDLSLFSTLAANVCPICTWLVMGWDSIQPSFLFLLYLFFKEMLITVVRALDKKFKMKNLS
jgi:hypothetical protein